MFRPASSATRRIAASDREWSSCVPCEKFRRKTSTPASIRSRSRSSVSDAGPTVATILVRTRPGGSGWWMGMTSRISEDQLRSQLKSSILRDDTGPGLAMIGPSGGPNHAANDRPIPHACRDERPAPRPVPGLVSGRGIVTPLTWPAIFIIGPDETTELYGVYGELVVIWLCSLPTAIVYSALWVWARRKLPRVRFTVRRLMVATAVAAVMLGPVAHLLPKTPPNYHRAQVSPRPSRPSDARGTRPNRRSRHLGRRPLRAGRGCHRGGSLVAEPLRRPRPARACSEGAGEAAGLRIFHLLLLLRIGVILKLRSKRDQGASASEGCHGRPSSDAGAIRSAVAPPDRERSQAGPGGSPSAGFRARRTSRPGRPGGRGRSRSGW